MWQLPNLKWQGHEWTVTLAKSTSAALVGALLSEPAERAGRAAAVLQGDPAFVLWILCRTPPWREQVPPHLTAVAEHWLRAIVTDPDFSLAPAAEEPVGRGEGSDPAELLRARGTAPSPSSCPWWPRWLASDLEKFWALLPATSSTPAPDDWAELLPAVLQAVRREAQWEKTFGERLQREKLASLKELAYGASHEINNPLANIATRAQTLLRDEGDPERKRKLATIAAQAFRAHDMISDMMLFAKPPRLQRDRFDLAQLVQEIVDECRSEAESQGTAVRAEFAASVPVHADRTQLGVAIKAVVRNALEALAADGTINIRVRPPSEGDAGDWISISIRDSGPGLSEEVQRHLFDPFYSGREAGRGLGFGLSKAWRICELHGGRIDVRSEPGFGAEFTLCLPAG